MTTIQLPYPPSMNTIWRSYHGHVVLSAAARRWKRDAQMLALGAGMRPLAGAVVVMTTLHPKLTKAGMASKQRQDCDNHIKITLDALNGVGFIDDKQVIRIVAEVGEPIQGGGLTVTVKQHGGSE